MHAPNQPLRWNSDHADHDHACMYWILWVTEWKFMHAWSGCWLFEIDIVWKCRHSAPARDLWQLSTTEMDSLAIFGSRKVVASYFLHKFWPTLLLSEDDLHTFDLRPLLSQNNPPDQITLLRFWSKIHIRFLQRACMKNWIKFYWLRSQYFNDLSSHVSVIRVIIMHAVTLPTRTS